MAPASTSTTRTDSRPVAIVGAGPAGLMAAEVLAAAGHRVIVFERMPSPGRKLLIAGRGGLNLTHSEPLEAFLARYTGATGAIAAAVRAFPPEALVAWANGLGQPTFIGSSGRVFPTALKASPLLRAWLGRLASLGVELRLRHRWTGWTDAGTLAFERPSGAPVEVDAAATLLALGGGSWPRLGSDGAWVPILARAGVDITSLAPSNCGVLVAWSEHVRERFAGQPLKRIAVTVTGHARRGEAVVTRQGLEGGAIYAVSGEIRRARDRGGPVTLVIDLRPDLDIAALTARLAAPRAKQSTATFLKKRLALPAVAIALMREAAGSLPDNPAGLAGLVKSVPLPVIGLAPIDRAISSAGGIHLNSVDARFMLRARPGVFVAGEMLDWDAPTGGYLLQASLAVARVAALGMDAWLAEIRGASLGALPGSPAPR